MRKFFKFIATSAFAAALLAAPGCKHSSGGGGGDAAQPTVPVEQVIIESQSTTLELGGTQTLTASVLPEDATDKSVTWTSSDDKVATVDKDGIVTAVGAGTANITASAGGVSATCEVKVYTNINSGFEVGISPDYGEHISDLSLNGMEATVTMRDGLTEGGKEFINETYCFDWLLDDKYLKKGDSDNPSRESTINIEEAAKTSGLKLEKGRIYSLTVLVTTVEGYNFTYSATKNFKYEGN